jgi:hypothetical protein
VLSSTMCSLPRTWVLLAPNLAYLIWTFLTSCYLLAGRRMPPCKVHYKCTYKSYVLLEILTSAVAFSLPEMQLYKTSRVCSSLSVWDPCFKSIQHNRTRYSITL